MKNTDPFTSEEFTPKRHNQRFACRANQIAYNNMLARKKRELLRESSTKLNTNRSVLKKLLERGEKNVSRDFLRGAGLDFNYFTQNTSDEKGNYMAVYDYYLQDLRNGNFNIFKVKIS